MCAIFKGCHRQVLEDEYFLGCMKIVKGHTVVLGNNAAVDLLPYLSSTSLRVQYRGTCTSLVTDEGNLLMTVEQDVCLVAIQKVSSES